MSEMNAINPTALARGCWQEGLPACFVRPVNCIMIDEVKLDK
jgi:hypothetical protein